MGGMMGGGASAPTLDPAQSQQLIDIYNRNIAGTTRATDKANIASVGRQTLAGLNMLTNQGESMNADELVKLRRQEKADAARIKNLESRIANTKNPKTLATLQSRLDALTTTQSERTAKINTLASPDFAADKLRESFSEQYGMRDDLIGSMRGAVDSTSEYRRMQDALGRGLTAQQTEAGALGDRLMQEAMAKMDQGGRLSLEAARNATQAARAGMASRGMATGNAGLAAELLNRDRYSRQREFENLGFAQNVQTQDLARRQTNTAMRADADRFNVGLLEQSAIRADQERLRQLGLQQDTYNFALGTDPRMVAAGLGSPYASLTGSTGAAANVVGGIASNPMYGGGQLSKGSGMHTQISGLVGAGFGAYFGGPAGATAGYSAGSSLGAATEGTAMDPFSWSDRRLKTDIKKIDGPTNVIGIPAYEYRYKGEKKKRLGVMAQDVQKVLPEAVAEFDYKGKKRLAIRPAVIGAALAEQLAEDTKPVALAS